jgi:serine/threonine-protein kinase RsbW
MDEPRVARIQDARLEDLPALAALVEESCRSADAETLFALKLAVEEVFTNIVTHGYRGQPGPVTVTVARDAGGIAVTLEDQAPSFDPALAPVPDLESDWEDRPLGGLGWHLVRQLVDEVRHRPRETGGNEVTLIKRLSAGSP